MLLIRLNKLLPCNLSYNYSPEANEKPRGVNVNQYRNRITGVCASASNRRIEWQSCAVKIALLATVFRCSDQPRIGRPQIPFAPFPSAFSS